MAMTIPRMTAGALAGVIAIGLFAPPAVGAAPRVIVYDESGPAALLLSGDGRRPGLAALPGVLHQAPATLLVPDQRRAGKVTAFDPTPATPTVVGLPATRIEVLLRDAIAKSGSHTVFLDELTADFRAGTGLSFRTALETLSRELSPWGEENLARHVHVYIPTPGWMLSDPAGWRDAWRILAMSGGVWLETFRARGSGPVPWAAEDWLSYPSAVSDALTAAGGDEARLHLLFGPGAQARSWRLARTRPNCALLANGPGAYRVSRDASAFLDQFATAFGADGAGRPRCLAEPAIRPALRRALAGALRLAEGAVVAPAAMTASPTLVAGRTVTLRVRLGADPFRLARRLSAPRARFWTLARPRLSILGVGVDRTIRLPRRGRVRIPLRLLDSGALEVRLLMDGEAIRAAIGRPASLARLIGPRPALRAIRARFVASPGTWDLTLPLRIAGRARARSTFEVARPVGVREATGGRSRADESRQRMGGIRTR